MKTIHYAQHSFVTADPIADELLNYSEALANHQWSAVVEVPVVMSGSASMARFLIGQGIPVVCVPRPADGSASGHGGVDDRDEFGSPSTDVDAAASVIGELVVHRTVRALRDGAEAARTGDSPKRLHESASDGPGDAEVRVADTGPGTDGHHGTVTQISDGASPWREITERSEQREDRT